ncbi:MAG TPA: acyltransferase family protein [Streptosporangiaceae bacterium]|nr:acyltransferase family protein [Streptosporangiaceae bacterium]
MGQGRRAKGRTRAPGLDGVRAIAVLAVMGFHEGVRALGGGFFGVDVFFVLSGFLITDLLATQPRDLKAFWLRRARRLLPALAVMLLVVTAAATVIEPDQKASLRLALLAAATYTSNWYQMLHHVPYFQSFGPPSPLQHLWSLAIEEQFYLLWPLILWFGIGRLKDKRVAVMVTLLAAVVSAAAMALRYNPANPSAVYYGTDTHASALLLGAALALACPLATLSHSKAVMTRRLDAIGVAGLVILGWAIGHFNGDNAAVYPFGLLIAAVAAAALIAAAASRGAIAAITSARPLRWIGVRSYAMYLWHWPVITLTAALAGRAAAYPATWAAETGITIALAAASWHFVESPILQNGIGAWLRNLRHKLAMTFTRPAAALPVAAAIVVSCVAVYGIAAPAGTATDNGLLRQVAEGERISAASQAQPVPTAAATHAAPATRHGGTRRALQRHLTRHVRAAACPANGWQVTAIGDSVMLASAVALAADLPGIYIDAKVGMQMQTGVQLVRELASSGSLRHYVVIGLGTNGAITPGEIWQLREAAPHRELIIVNTYGPMSWESEVNSVLASSTWHKPHVTLANWAAAAAAHPGLLWSDGIHPRPAGGRLYAGVVLNAIRSACGS